MSEALALEKGTGEVTALATLRRAAGLIPGFGKGLGLTVGLALVGGLGQLIVPVVLQNVIDSGLRVRGSGLGTGLAEPRAGAGVAAVRKAASGSAVSVRFGQVALLCAVAAVVTVITQAARRASAYRLGAWSEWLMAQLRIRGVERFLDMSLDQHAQSKRGVLVSRVTGDVESISQFFSWGAVSWLTNVLIVFLMAGYLFWIDWRLAVVGVLVALPVIVVMRVVQRILLRNYQLVRVHSGEYLGRVSEVVTGASVLRAYGAERLVGDRALAANRLRRNAAKRTSLIGALLFPVGDLFAVLSICAVISTGLIIGSGGGLTAGVLVGAVFATRAMLDPFAELTEVVDQTQLAVAGLSRVLDVLDMPVDLVETRSPVALPVGGLSVSVRDVSYAYPARPSDDASDAGAVPSSPGASRSSVWSAGASDPAGRSVKSIVRPGDGVGPAAFDAGAPDPAGRSVESTVRSSDEVGPAAFDAGVPDPTVDSPSDRSFDTEPLYVLQGVSIEVPAGSSLAVVGATGSGKSTLARLVMRTADPQVGSVHIGDIDVRSIAERDLRHRVQLVPQDPFLFDLSIGENIALGVPGLPQASLLAAVERLGLSDWIAQLPEGLNTTVGERGSSLSAGERQLVALVRAEVMAPDVLVLDEATSSVDAGTEARLAATIDELSRGRTTIVIVHRLSTAARADAVVVFDAGQVVEYGTHESLIAADGHYAHLVADWNESVA
jgi:ATP-binding cassette, subfamily B, bacterial